MAEILENTSTPSLGMIKSRATTGLTLGIIGTALGGLSFMRGNGNNGGLLGGLFGTGNSNNQHPCGVTLTNQEIYLERKQCSDLLGMTKDYYEAKIEAKQALNDAWMEAYQRDVKNSFELYNYARTNNDNLNAKIEDVNKKVDILSAIRPYQDALINAKIDNNALVADYNLAKRTCRMVQGEIVLPSTPTITGFGSYGPCSYYTVTDSSSATGA